MAEHPTEKPNKINIHSIFKMPFVKALSDKNIKNAFKSCGIIRLDRNAIPQEKITPFLLTQRPFAEAEVPVKVRPKTSPSRPDTAISPSSIDSVLKTPVTKVTSP